MHHIDVRSHRALDFYCQGNRWRLLSPDSLDTFQARDRAEQLELFDLPRLIRLPPCGRNLGRCEAVIEHSPDGPILRCVACGGIAPYRAQKSSARSPARQSTDALSAILTGFIRSQLKFLQSKIAPDDPGKSGTEGGPAL
jgi:hypothetical protein